jgi:UDP-N-acetylmuramoyl-L-alanyl-D-glutamate--2,6-diaminopimelate ligase
VCVLIDSKDFECGVPTIRIDHLSTHLVTLAQQMYGGALKVDVIGITGTNGKTSVAWFISQLLARLDNKNGHIGTLGISHSEQHSEQTTPDILTLYRTRDGYEKDGIKTAVLIRMVGTPHSKSFESINTHTHPLSIACSM